MNIPLIFLVAYSVLGVPTPPGEISLARAMNSNGVVAGRMGKAAFTWNGRRLVRYKEDQFFYMDGDYTNVATAINAHEVAVGHNGSYGSLSMSGLELATATVYSNGVMSYINKSGNGTFESEGINDLGWIVGADGYRGFVRKPDGTMIEVEPLSTRPEWNGTRASAIDNEGDVVGGTTINVGPVGQVQCGEQSIGMNGPMQPMYCPDTSKYVIHAFLATFGAGAQHMRDLGTITGFPDTYATALAEDGTVVGYSGTSSGAKWTRVGGASHAWMWYHGRMSDLGILHRGEESAAFGVNDRGVVVGCSGRQARFGWEYDAFDPVNPNVTAVRWVNKRIQDLNSLIAPNSGWALTCARAVNSRGWIAGEGYYKGVARAFVLVPAK